MSKQVVIRLLKVTLFLAILFLSAELLNELSKPPAAYEDSVPAFRALPANSIEVLFIGNSHMGCTLLPMEIFKTGGFATWNLRSPGSNYEQMYARMDFGLQHQKPKVVVVEMFGAAGQMKTTDYINFSTFTDMPPSIIKYETMLKTSSIATQTANLLLPLIYYRSNLMNLDRDRVVNRLAVLRDGNAALNLPSTAGGQILTEPMPINQHDTPIPRNYESFYRSMEVMKRMYGLAEANDVEVIAFFAPVSSENQSYFFQATKDWLADNLPNVRVVDSNEHLEWIIRHYADTNSDIMRTAFPITSGH